MAGAFGIARLGGEGAPTPTTSKPSAADAGAAKLQSDQQDKVASDLTARFESWFEDNWNDYRSAYITYHQLVWQSILMYCGQLWIQWDKTRKNWMPAVPDDEWTPQPNINRFSPAIDAIASICRWPEVEAVPKRTDDIKAYEISEIANMLADKFVTDNGLRGEECGQEDKLGELAYNFVLAGCALTDVRVEVCGEYEMPMMVPQDAWGVQCTQCDTYNKVPMGDVPPPDVCEQCGNPTSISRTTVQVPSGNNAQYKRYKFPCNNISPIGLLPRQGSHGMHDCGFLFSADRMPLDVIWERFKYVAEPDSMYIDGYSQNYDTALNFWMTGYASTTVANKSSAMVVQVFVQPNKVKDLPEGLYAVRINERTVKCEPWPFGPDHPLTKGDYLKVPRLFFPRSVAFDIAEIQREMNGYESIIKLHGMTSAVEPVVVDENTQVTQITGRADKIVKWRSIGPGSREPHRMTHGTLDDGIYKQRGELKAELENITGAVSVYRGQQPGSVTAAAAISQLRGQADMMFNRPVSNWMGLCRETVRKGVKLMQATLQPWEISEIIGEGKDTQITLFKAADLDAVLDWISTTHGLPRTRDEKRQEMMELFDRGALDVNDANVREKIYELFGETGMMQQFNKDATRARMENEVMAQGGQPTFMPDIEDSTVHFSIHAEYIKSLDFDKLPDQCKEELIAHALETKQYLMEQQALAAGMGTAGPGPGAGEGGAGGGAAGPGGKPSPNGGAAHPPSPNGPAPNPNKGKPGHARTNPRAKPNGPRTPSPSTPGPSGQPTVPTGPNGPGADLIPGGNR